ADGDQILAVIKGSAINNDGIQKVGFTAPSVEGQKDVINAALEVAEVEPQSVSYIECHGTGTPLGDPIEVAALSQVFTQRAQGSLKLGAVKTGIGHLDAAAGVSGLIKTVMCLQHQYLPPTLHFEQGNPNIDWSGTGFEVVSQGQHWESTDIRRAGVSSFGIGGTNAHIVLEEYQDERQSGESRAWQLLPHSARSRANLGRVTERLSHFLGESDEVPLADSSFTLQVGRRHLNYRQVALCRDSAEAVAVLSGEKPAQLLQGNIEQAPAVTLMFSGQGSQYVGMTAGLYETEAVYREQVDNCLEQLPTELAQTLKALLFGDSQEAAKLNDTAITQPALFIVEYALAKQLQEWGVSVDAMIGHSLGEYVAATLSGVLSLEDALKLVTARGKLMGSAASGAMLSVELSAQATLARLPAGLSLAADNSSELCVVSGETQLITQFSEALAAEDIKHSRLHTSHAYHSEMMAPILPAFRAVLEQVTFNPPSLPYISNVTGDWVTAEAVQDIEYWCRHLRGTVAFSEGLKTLLADENRLFLEVGPGRSLCSFVQRHEAKQASHIACNGIRHVKDEHGDDFHLAWLLGRLYVAGVNIDWQSYRAEEQRLRRALPSYPFEHQEFRPGAVKANTELAAEPVRVASTRHQRPNLATAYVAPQTEQEQQVAEIWCELFRLEEVSK
ncbi:type I polyketide synthase, partial [Pseudoalteromonas piscicida]